MGVKVKLLWLQLAAPAASLMSVVSAGGPPIDAAAAFSPQELLLGCSCNPAAVLSVAVRRSMAAGLRSIMQQHVGVTAMTMVPPAIGDFQGHWVSTQAMGLPQI